MDRPEPPALVLLHRQGPDAGGRGWKVVNNLALNYHSRRHTQVAVHLGAKYRREDLGGRSFCGWTDLVNLELRQNLGRRWDIGLQHSILHSWRSGQLDRSAGASVGFNFLQNVWTSLGYNFAGFRDADFSGGSYTAQGPFLRFRLKIDQETLASILGRSHGVSYEE